MKVRILSRQLTDEELRPLEPDEVVVQLSRLPTDAQLQRLASIVPLPPEPYRYAYVRRGDMSTPDGPPWDAPDWPGFRSADRG